MNRIKVTTTDIIGFYFLLLNNIYMRDLNAKLFVIKLVTSSGVGLVPATPTHHALSSFIIPPMIFQLH